MKFLKGFLITAVVFVAIYPNGFSVLGQDEIDPEAQAIIDDLPEDLQTLYVEQGEHIHAADLGNFVTTEPPWKFCFSDSYQGNPWRVAVRQEFERLVQFYQDEGYIEEFAFLDADNDIPLQNAHILQLVEEECDIIFSIPGSADGLDEGINTAFEEGVPFITGEGTVTNPHAITVTSNFYTWGFDMAAGIAEELDGEGNVLLVEGLEGHDIVLLQRQGADAGFELYPDISILGSVNGDWTPDITKNALREILDFIDVPIDAVWTTGSEARFVAEAFEERGLPTPLITASISGDALAYWADHKDTFRFYGHGNLPERLAQAMFRVGVRILLGQTPKLNIMMLPLPEVKQDSLENWYESCMELDTLSIFPIPPTDPTSDELLNAYFENGDVIPEYSYEDTPSPCDETSN
jgi:ribose transport system substrate-binding protein